MIRFATHRPVRRVVRRRPAHQAAAVAMAVCVVLGFLGAGPVDAQVLDPTFFIESVRVEGLERASAELIIAESLLEPGFEYIESELQQAAFRVQRLPFVLDATFVIERGSERGRYGLVIHVEEIKRWFFGEDGVFTLFTNSIAFDNPIADDWTIASNPLAGIRLFAGRYNVFFASLSGGSRGAQVGYTRYNLFDRRIVFNLGLTAGGCCATQVFALGLDPTFSSWQNQEDSRQAQASLGVPLSQRTSLSLRLTRTYSEAGERRNLLGLDGPRGTLEYLDLIQDTAELSLLYDSTDDPVFPSRGLTFVAGFDYERLESDLVVPESQLFNRSRAIELPPGLGPSLPPFKSQQWRVSGTLTQHWPITRRHTLTLSARLAAGQADVENLPVVESRECPALDLSCRPNTLRLVEAADLDVFESQFIIQVSSELWSRELTRKVGDFRLENRLEFGYDRTEPALDLAENPLYRKSITTSLVFRNAWGLFRFSIQILDLGEGF
ncbi:MAG: BamA/TamA family outer membrane protein [Acidobacteriota bacterium]